MLLCYFIFYYIILNGPLERLHSSMNGRYVTTIHGYVNRECRYLPIASNDHSSVNGRYLPGEKSKCPKMHPKDPRSKMALICGQIAIIRHCIL